MHPWNAIFWFCSFCLQYQVQGEEALDIQVNKLCYSCPASDDPCLYKSADSECLLLMQVSCR